jgi:dethiobiotin synthetase
MRSQFFIRIASRAAVSMCPNCARNESPQIFVGAMLRVARAHHEPRALSSRPQIFDPHKLRRTVHALRVEHDIVVVEIEGGLARVPIVEAEAE